MLFRFHTTGNLDNLQTELNRIFAGKTCQTSSSKVTQPMAKPVQQADSKSETAAAGPAAEPKTTQKPAIQWAPAVDVYEGADAYVLHAELPGLQAQDLALNLDNRTLTLEGERKAPTAEAKTSRISQRAFGRFSRTFKLPNTVQSDKIAAEFKDGVLTVTLPKAEEVKPRLIKVNAA